MIDTLPERFTRRIWPEPNSGCWLWGGGVNRRGYGRAGKRGIAHRMVFEHVNGPIPDGMHVCHICDNPSCVNPVHLFLGTHQDNMDDKCRKGRQARGTHGPSARLSYAKAAEVRALLASGVGVRKVARLYGVQHTSIMKVRDGVTWKAPLLVRLRGGP